MAVPRLVVNKCIWIRSGISDRQYIFRSIRNALIERGLTVLTLNGPKDHDGMERIRKVVWNSDAHIMLDVMMPAELKALYPVFKDRKNFSMGLVDWWANVYWFTKNADYLAFRNYNGIAIRHQLEKFANNRKPPLLSLPQAAVPYELASASLRLLALAVAPFLEMFKARQRWAENIPPGQMLYFPFTIAAEHVPLTTEARKFDFCNVSSTRGYWILRDPHASAWLNFADLYHDRARITNLISQISDRKNQSYRLYDVRRGGWLNWESYCQIVRQSGYAICTGGLHQNSVAKYTEFACLGTPLFGEELPFEYPWLKDCLFPVDTLNVTRENLEPQLCEALSLEPKLRENCLNVRNLLLQLYNPQRVLDLLQEQADGKPIPPGYLKREAFSGA
jgi:hypothetical protein